MLAIENLLSRLEEKMVPDEEVRQAPPLGTQELSASVLVHVHVLHVCVQILHRYFLPVSKV